MKLFYFTLIFCNFFVVLFAQRTPGTTYQSSSSKQQAFIAHPPDSTEPQPGGRKWLAAGTTFIGSGGSILFHYKSMNYKYESNFHQKNDMRAWMKMDKALHAFLAYSTSRLATEMWQWAGMSHRRATLTGSVTSIAYLTIKEYIDGHNAKGGWSWGDAGANISGVAFFAAQELAWKEQKIQFKVSARTKTYDPTLERRTDKLFGTSTFKRLVKDYNAQTYWLSGNVRSILKLNNFPAWLNLSFGMGAEDMYGNYANVIYDDDGTASFDRSDIKRYRQWYIAPDIDLTKIKTEQKVLRTLFTVFNSIKIPAPALEVSRGKLKGHFIYF